MPSRPGSADGRAAAKPPRQRPKAKDVKEKGKGKRPRRPPPVGHRQTLPDQLEDPNEYGVRVSTLCRCFILVHSFHWRRAVRHVAALVL